MFLTRLKVFMTTVSDPRSASSSNLESLVLRRVASVKNITVAQAIKHDEGHVSRVMSGERGLKLAELQAFFDVLGLKVIECEGPTVTISAKTYESLTHLLKEAL